MAENSRWISPMPPALSKSALKRLLGSRYDAIRSIKNGPLPRCAAATLKKPYALLAQRMNGPYLAANISADMGMGAVLTHLIKLTKFADDQGKMPVITARNRLYSRIAGENFLGRYFIPAILPEMSRFLINFDVRNEFDYGVLGAQQHMSISEANKIFNLHYRFSKLVIDEVKAATDSAGCSLFDVSVHYRGTDKYLEAALAPHDAVLEAVREQLLGQSEPRIFLATDSAAFKNAFYSEFSKSAVTVYERGYSQDEIPRHYSAMSPDDKALEAIVNIILLSKARTCVRTSSYMSAWSKILNPNLITFTLNRTHGDSKLFPESEIINDERPRKVVAAPL